MFEPYPKGTSISYPVQSNSNSLSTLQMRGTVISVPIPQCNSPLPISDTEASPYVVQLVEGSIHQISPDTMEQFVVWSV
jgi:hypothetical protein